MPHLIPFPPTDLCSIGPYDMKEPLVMLWQRREIDGYYTAIVFIFETLFISETL